MVARHLCEACHPTGIPGLIEPGEPTHHPFKRMGYTRKGLLGGWECPCPCQFTPLQLYEMAQRQHPDDPVAARARYAELMREAGHIRPAKPGEDRNLPCGWPHLPPVGSSLGDSDG